MPYPSLTGRLAIVTGAARGLGLAAANRLAAEGCRVLFADVRNDVREAGRAAGQPWIVTDLAAPDGLHHLFEEADRLFDGGLDILVNSAGIVGPSLPFDELTPEEYRRVMTVNAEATLFATQAAGKRMVPRARGSIINFASVGAVMATAEQMPYAVSKAAVKHLTAIAALSLAPYGVRVNAIAPGPIHTDMVTQFSEGQPGMLEGMLSRIPAGRLGSSEEIAAIVAFLASDEASYIFGQTIFAEGGRMALGYHVEPA